MTTKDDTSRLIMFLVHLETDDDRRKWKEVLREHPGWYGTMGLELPVDDTKTVIIPNMTYECAEKVDEVINEKGLERTWVRSNESMYDRLLKECGWG